MLNVVDHKLDSIQVLRGIAAILVVALHVFRATTLFVAPSPNSIIPPLWLTQFGAIGVDVFFVISGFLMAHISEPYFSGRKTASQFMAQRIIRIWPPYVVATLFVVALIAVPLVFNPTASWPFNLQAYRLASIVFIPSFNEGGELQPIIGPGWTLNYEITFYACFALTLCLGRRFAFLKLAAILCLLFLIGLFAPQGVVHSFFGNPIIFEFIIGAAIGFATKTGRLEPAHGWAWIVAAFVLLAAFYTLGIQLRLLAYGLPAAALFVGFLALEGKIRWPRVLLLFGDASYSIYLIHTLVIYRVIKVGFFERLHFGVISTLSASLVAIAIAICAGLLYFWLVERPLLRACQKAYNRMSGHRSRPPLVARQP